MPTSPRQEILNSLHGAWAAYVQRFGALSPAAQAAFLREQGYARFADLLAHIIAWWEVGHQAVDRYLADPTAQPKKYDVDAFNADAVAKAAGLADADVIAAFENRRRFLIEFVTALPDSAFDNERVVHQLTMEFVGHLNDHKLPDRN